MLRSPAACTPAFFAATVAAASLLAACGDNQATGDSVDTQAPTTTASVPGGVVRSLPESLILTANEPATIYYTTDGTAPDTSSDHGPSPVVVSDLDVELRIETARDGVGPLGVDDAPPRRALAREGDVVEALVEVAQRCDGQVDDLGLHRLGHATAALSQT